VVLSLSVACWVIRHERRVAGMNAVQIHVRSPHEFILYTAATATMEVGVDRAFSFEPESRSSSKVLSGVSDNDVNPTSNQGSSSTEPAAAAQIVIIASGGGQDQARVI
jgi:hypothetical protein